MVDRADETPPEIPHARPYTIAFTGHRPGDPAIGSYNGINPALASRLHETLARLKTEHPDLRAISGMAQGFDTWAAETCIALKIPFAAAVPFRGQELIWPPLAQKKYAELIAKATEVHVVCEGGFAAWKLQRRNEFMVDRCNLLIAAWDGEEKGGTWNAVKYARKKGVKMINLLDGVK